jgi:hypothetical protein
MEPIPQNLYLPNVLWYPLAVDKARYAGEWVAAVVATSRYQAEDAAELVEVTYEPLAPVIDPEEALKPEAPPVHDRGLLYEGFRKDGSAVTVSPTVTIPGCSTMPYTPKYAAPGLGRYRMMSRSVSTVRCPVVGSRVMMAQRGSRAITWSRTSGPIWMTPPSHSSSWCGVQPRSRKLGRNRRLSNGTVSPAWWLR